jgi:predicted kinase
MTAREEGVMLLSEVAERRDLDTPLLLALADSVAGMHAAAPIARTAPAIPGLERHAALLAKRAAAGRVRHGHGGLELASVALTEAGPAPIGGSSAPIDSLHDLSGLLTDLWRRGLFVQANIVANRYVDVAPQGASGWALLHAMIAAVAEEPALADPVPPRLVAIGGLSGTGKSTLSRQLAAYFGRTPGARVLRSDVFRKRIVGLPPEARLPASHYTAPMDTATWEAVFESADDHIACGNSVILDAVFMRRSERDVAEALAARRRVPFTGLWLEAPERDRLARVMTRSGDASDAGIDVVREQSRRSAGELSRWHRIRANRPMEMIVQAARAALTVSRR